jgi:hypothetical protein
VPGKPAHGGAGVEGQLRTATTTAAPLAADAARTPRIRQWLFERVRTAVARAAQIELINLKRHYKSMGHTDPEIHSVIPDRPQPKKPAPAAPTAGEAPPA